MYDAKEIIKNLKKISNSKDNKELAEKIGISYNTLNTWTKRNTIGSSFDAVYKFCKENNYSLDEVFGMENPLEKRVEINDVLLDKAKNQALEYGLNVNSYLEHLIIEDLKQKNNN